MYELFFILAGLLLAYVSISKSRDYFERFAPELEQKLSNEINKSISERFAQRSAKRTTASTKPKHNKLIENLNYNDKIVDPEYKTDIAEKDAAAYKRGLLIPYSKDPMVYEYFYRLNVDDKNNYFGRAEDISNYLLKKSTDYKRINTHRHVYRDLQEKAKLFTREKKKKKNELLEGDEYSSLRYLDFINANRDDKQISYREFDDLHTFDNYSKFVHQNYFLKNAKNTERKINEMKNAEIEKKQKAVIEKMEGDARRTPLAVTSFLQNKEGFLAKAKISAHNMVNRNLEKLKDLQENFKDLIHNHF
jgi:hypothetical protein